MANTVQDVSARHRILSSNKTMAALWLLGYLSGRQEQINQRTLYQMDLIGPNSRRPDMLSRQVQGMVRATHISDGQTALDMTAARSIALATCHSVMKKPILLERLREAHASTPNMETAGKIYRSGRSVAIADYERRLLKSLSEIVKVINTVFQVE